MKAKYRGERPRRRPSQEERIEAKYKGRTPRVSCAPAREWRPDICNKCRCKFPTVRGFNS